MIWVAIVGHCFGGLVPGPLLRPIAGATGRCSRPLFPVDSAYVPDLMLRSVAGAMGGHSRPLFG